MGQVMYASVLSSNFLVGVFFSRSAASLNTAEDVKDALQSVLHTLQNFFAFMGAIMTAERYAMLCCFSHHFMKQLRSCKIQ